jgi:uncharacterized HAD superfamily protein
MKILKRVNKKSPVLKKGIKNFLIDIDGTICPDIPNEEPKRMVTCKPFSGARESIAKLYDAGHIISFFTSRTTKKHKKITETWLKKHGFKYHNLLMDKPRGGNYHWIDNHPIKTTRYKKSWKGIK